jgi:hypothetical protein
MPDDARLFAPSALRNRDPILAVLRDVLPPAGLVLEIASGSGEHVIHFAAHLPALTWQPSDPTPEARASIAEWVAAEGLQNIRPPLDIDAAAAIWPVAHADALIAINMIHISPWAATEGLMRGAGKLLPTGAPLVLYGPYRQSERPLAASNAEFDADLRDRNPAWGLRDLDEVARTAEQHGLMLDRIIAMPANNLTVVFRKH